MNAGEKSVGRAAGGERVLRGDLEGKVGERIRVGRDDLLHNQWLRAIGARGVNVEDVNPRPTRYRLLATWLREFKITMAEVGQLGLAQMFPPAIPDRLRDGEHTAGAE